MPDQAVTGQESWRRELAATFAAASSEVLYVVRVQPEVSVEFISPGVLGLLGYVPAEFYADPSLWRSVVDAHDVETVRALSIGEPGQESHGIVRWVAKNGHPVWVHHRWLVVDRAGGGKALYGAARALSSAQRPQDLAEQVDYLRLLLENVTDVVLDIAPDDTFRWASPAIEDVLGWRPAEIIGKPTSMLVHPDDQAASTRDEKRPTGATRVRLRTAAGGWRWMSGSWRETRDHTGRVLGRVAGLHDIEDTVQAELALESSEEHFRLLAENGSDMVFRSSTGPRPVSEWVSPSVTEVLGWKPQDFVGKSAVDLIHPDDMAQFGPTQALIQAGQRASYEARLLSSSGEYRWMSITVRPVVDESGRVVARVGSAHDIQREVQARHQLARSERLFRLAMASAPMGMAVVDLDRNFLQVNAAMCRIANRGEDWLLAHSLTDILDPDYEADDARMRQALINGEVESTSGEKCLLRPDGTGVWVEHSVGLLRDENGEPLSFVCQFVDVTAAKRLREDLAYLADHDPLTGLLTRRALVTGIERMTSHPARSNTSLGALFIDLDGFKRTNDTHGHAAGDELLSAVAHRITASARSEDLVARLGGDEIVVVLPGLHSVDDALRVADKIHDALSQPVVVGGQPMRPRVSIGAALAEPGESADSLLHRADLALYRAKQQGRNRTVAYTADLG